MRSLDLPRDAGAVYRKRAGVVSRHHDDTMMRDENRAKKCEKCLILLNKFAGVVQWQNGSFPSFDLGELPKARITSKPDRLGGNGRSQGAIAASLIFPVAPLKVRALACAMLFDARRNDGRRIIAAVGTISMSAC